MAPVENSPIPSAPSNQSNVTGSSFPCTQCDKAFNRRENLSRHLKTHQTTKTHQCLICGKEFTRSDLRKRHEGIHKASPAQIQGQNQARKEDTGRKRKRGSVIAQSPSEDSTSRSEHPSVNPEAPYFISGIDLPGGATSGVDTLWRHVADIPLDFSSLNSPSGSGLDAVSSEWFPGEFYAALQETDNGWDHIGGLPTMALPEPHINIAGFEDPAQASVYLDSRLTNFATQGAEHSQQDQNHDTSGISRLSRVSSPPNDASEEDKWPFAWNPRSRPLLSCNPIIWPDDHPLLKSHNLKYDMSASTYEKVMRCVTSINNFHYSSEQRVQISMPTLSVSNVFVGLFFEYFLPQMPVIHLPTVNVDKDLPPSLLAAMIVIGAIYSREKHTRRFAILLLDLTRRSLLSSIELNNSLIREPMIIYALCLVCYTGLWCGNKRSFELAEAIRGFVVSFCRRKGFGNIFHGGTTGNPEPPDTETGWRKWASEESLKRLSWVVYTLDYQFPSLLNLPATISLGELSYQECPCDEEFWVAPNARHWKRLLGSASVPPSKWFAAALGPFIVPHVGNGSTTQSISGAEDPPVLNLNPWSRFLVLLAIHAQIYNFSQEMTLISRICGDENSGYSYAANYRISAAENESVAEEIRITLGGSAETSEWTVWHVLANTKHQLLSALTSWASTYGQIPQGHPQESATSVFFHSCSKPLHQLGLILLDAPLTQLQDAIGKAGPSHIPEAMRNLSLWANTSQQLRQSTVISFETITSMAPVNNHVLSQQLSNMGPWSIIPCFISHVVLWAFVQAAGSMQRQQLIERIQHDKRHLDGPFSAVLHRALNTATSAERGLPEVNLGQNGGQKVIFRSAADVLTRMGTWGCSLNLALLLYERSKL